jgi:hypothetical protein
MVNLKEILITLDNFGFSEIVIPFVLVFVLVYALVRRTKVFTNKSHAAMIALVSGFFFISFTVLVDRMLIFIPYFVLILVFIFMLQIVFGMAGQKVKGNKTIRVLFLVVMGFLFLIFFGLDPAEAIAKVISILFTPWVILILTIIGIFYYMTKDSGKNSKSNSNKDIESKPESSSPKEKKKEDNKKEKPKKEFNYDDIISTPKSKYKPSFETSDDLEYEYSIDDSKKENFFDRG